MKHASALGLGIILSVVVGCNQDTASDEPVGDIKQGLTVAVNDGAEFSGTYRLGEDVVRFSSILMADSTIHVGFELQGEVITTILYPEHETGAFDGRGLVLTQASKNILDLLTVELGDYYIDVDVQDIPLHEMAIPRTAGYLFESPPDHALPASDEITPFGFGDDGRVKLAYNKCYKAKYDKYNSGTQYTRNARAGSNWGTSACGAGNYACMGWCGPGCAWYGTGYCLDCLDHDVCSHNLCAGGGSGSTHCGDEYDHAYWDFVYGCGGTAKTPQC